jgi:amino acid adenylation domain-containing protein
MISTPAAGFAPTTLMGKLRRRAESSPERRIFSFLADGGEEQSRLTCGQLDLQARVIAGALQEAGMHGERAVLLFPPGLEFLSAFLGCLYAGVVPVPAVPPHRQRGIARLAAMVGDAQPRLALAPAAWRRRLAGWFAAEPALAGLRCLASDDLPLHLAEHWRAPAIDAADLAFIQYTSGSTAAPKGVMVSHANLSDNEALIQEAFGQSEASVIVGWLPLYHDMGLIGNLLQPLWCGARCILMSPMAFLQQPVRWLRAISRYGATTSGGPNFAFELCARRVAAEHKAGLDLGSWEVAFNGAEPVRSETLDRFAAAFAGCGFRRAAFRPCYGLAEATLLVAAARPPGGAMPLEVAAAALEQGRALPPADASRSRRLVSSGPLSAGPQVRIVDPGTATECLPGSVGEVWVAGGGVAQGYWRRPEATAETFAGRLPGNETDSFLRTGDLGFVSGGELYITGRIKDLIIVRGRNHHPQDIELTVERCHPDLRAGCGAAFAVELEGEERLVVAHEIARRAPAAGDLQGIVATVRRAIAEEHELAAHAILLLRPGTIPKTTSGKVRRQACRGLFLAGELAPLAAGALAPVVAGALAPLTGLAIEAAPPAATPPRAPAARRRRQQLESFLRHSAAEALRVDPARVERTLPLTALGLDSLAALEIKNAVEGGLGLDLDLARLVAGASIAELALDLQRQRREPVVRAAGSAALPEAPEPVPDTALAHGQQAIWFLQRLAPECAAYNLAAAARVLGEVDAGALRAAFAELSRRHEALRTRFPLAGDQPARHLQAAPAAPAVEAAPDMAFAEVDAAGWSEADLALRLAEEAHRPFDLAQGPLLRVSLYRLHPGAPVLLIVIHHIAADFGSLAVLWRELATLYDFCRHQGHAATAALPPPGAQFGKYVLWQRRFLGSGSGERSFAYWRDQLAGLPPELELPADRPRPRQQGFRGGACSLRLDGKVAAALRSVASGRSATLHMILLAAFQALLHRYTRQPDLAVGSPASGRLSSELAEVVGCLVNAVTLRARFEGIAAFDELLVQARAVTLGALDHQAYPFSLLAERLRPDRDPSRSPLFQAMFVLHGRPAAAPALAALAMREAGARLDLGTLALESMPLATRASQLDLTLEAAELDGTLALRLVYDADLFDRVTALRMVEHFAAALAGIAFQPGLLLSGLPLLAAAERHQLLCEWNATLRDYPRTACVHELFELQASRTPHAAALVDAAGAGEQRLTYQELNRRADALAGRLRRLGVGPEAPVGIFVQRSAELLVSVLAVWKAGGAFVPMDALYPPARLRQLCRDSGMRWLVGDDAAAELLRDAGPDAPALVRPADPGLTAGASEVTGIGGISGASEVSEVSGAGGAGSEPAARARPENLAYLIYTSGSTGQPKGVAVPHQALVNVLDSLAPRLGMTPRDTVAAFITLAFDMGVFELLLPLLSGGCLVVLPSAAAADGRRLAAALAAHAPTVVQATPATWSLLVAAGWEGSPAVRALCGGEALGQQLAGDLRSRSCRAWNMYGPTEAAVYACVHELAPAAGPPPIGRPIANTSLFVLDESLRPVPAGVAGELHIAGDGLARGYWNRPGQTAERFVPEPFSAAPGSRMYRTGDLARYRADGQIDYLGRLDGQVKIRGFRVELDEIRAQLCRHPAVREAAVICCPAEPGGEPRLVAYVAGGAAGAPAAAELRRFLAEQLPHYMVPGELAVLAALPLTPNGKVDRKALPPPPRRAGVDAGYAAPRTPAEELLAGMWAGLLAADRIGVHDNFFELGGHSLKAAQVIARVRDLFHVEVPLAALFSAPTVEGLAKAVAAARPGAAVGAPIAIPRLPAGREAPASFAQVRIWLLDRLQPGSAAYNMPLAVELAGALDAAALTAALAAIVRRHAVLGAAFPARDGQPVQAPAVRSWAPALADLSGLPEPGRAGEARRLGEREGRRPFDLERGPVFRALLVRLAAERHRLLLVVHHVAADGASLDVFLRELAELYAAAAARRPPALPAPRLQYADYAAWLRRVQTPPAALDYWRQKLAAAAPLDLPADRPRPAVQSFRGGTARLTLAAGLPAALAAAVRRQGLTPFVALYAAFTGLLHRYTGRRRVLAGTPVDGRDRLELEPLIGVFVNLLVLSMPVGGEMSAAELLGAARDELLAAYEHRGVPFDLLVETVQPQRSLSHNPLVQVTVACEPPLTQPRLPGLALTARRLDTGTAKFDLSLSAGESPHGFELALEYSADLFDQATALRLLDHLQRLLESMLAAPGLPLRELPLLSAGERQQLLREWNDTAADGTADAADSGRAEAAAGVCGLFEAQAERAPGAAALLTAEGTLSYGELNRLANLLAHRLRALGVAEESLVAICMPHSPEMIVAGLAALKAGAAYLPLDPRHPPERLREMLADAAPAAALTLSPWRSVLAGAAPALLCVDELMGDLGHAPNPPRRTDPEGLAYVIYTSGSSGRPKGVAVPHQGLLNLVRWHQRTYRLTAADRGAQLAGPAFDAAVWEVWPYLTAGASLRLIAGEEATLPASPAALRAWIAGSGLSLAFLPTPLAEAVLALPAPDLGVRALLTGGDRLRAGAPAGGPRVINHYGPTENSVVATAGPVPAAAGGAALPPAIGRPIDNVEIFVLDSELQPVPIGVPGEIHLAGRGLARGYLRRPELTAQAFVPSPFAAEPGARLYRTGDRARLLPDGNLDFLGRLDHQVKIRGFRVELGEIEALLLRHPAIREGVVGLRDGAGGGQRLVAYLVPSGPEPPVAADLRGFLAARLPDYMVPSVFLALDRMPLTTNGKIDRGALPDPEPGWTAAASGTVSPRTPLEEVLAEVWSQLLGVPVVGVHDDFFALGGHSLQVAQMQSRVRDLLGVELPLQAIFREPTVAQLAAALTNQIVELADGSALTAMLAEVEAEAGAAGR